MVYSDVIATVVIDTHLATMLIYLVAMSYRITFPAQASLRVSVHCVVCQFYHYNTQAAIMCTPVCSWLIGSLININEPV